MAQEIISTLHTFEDNKEPSSKSAFSNPPDCLTNELHGSAEYDPSQTFEEALPDMGDWMYDDGHMFSEGFKEGLSEECDEQSNLKDTKDKSLYNSASISVAEFLLIIMAYVNCHRVTDKALSDLLKMLKLLLPDSLNTHFLNRSSKTFFLVSLCVIPFCLA